MAATSVTGVSGVGSVQDGLSKGSPHMTLGVNHLIGPRVLASGTTTCSSTTGLVTHETLPDTTSNVVILTSSTAVAPFVAARDESTFTITAGSGAVVNWMIVSKGNSVAAAV